MEQLPCLRHRGGITYRDGKTRPLHTWVHDPEQVTIKQSRKYRISTGKTIKESHMGLLELIPRELWSSVEASLRRPMRQDIPEITGNGWVKRTHGQRREPHGRGRRYCGRKASVRGSKTLCCRDEGKGEPHGTRLGQEPRKRPCRPALTALSHHVGLPHPSDGRGDAQIASSSHQFTKTAAAFPSAGSFHEANAPK